MENIKTKENEMLVKAREIIEPGFKKAAESMAFFMHEKIDISPSDYKFSNESNLENLIKHRTGNITLLTTELIGELRGVCYLIFNDTERDALVNVALSPEMLSDMAKKAMMTEAILLEVDNIISASVITQFSNKLKLKVFGGVPKLSQVNELTLIEIFKKVIESRKLLLSCKTEFSSGNSNFHPEFFWALDPVFFELSLSASQKRN